ncbi:Hypothetical predicted protein [Mytilus galloprovincialis]|uniref:Uncharacterized protein n=1 Tax=Mytilus galloprovincialis TaxID=29158 RepID=A0A8B6HAK0_MYTGA|nr:Hypothetical predicted protein [Mytilus galloprovincialis]
MALTRFAVKKESSHDALEKSSKGVVTNSRKKEPQRDITITELPLQVINSYRTNLCVVIKLFASKGGHLLLSDEAHEHSFQTIEVYENEINVKSETRNIKVFDITEIKKSEFILSFADETLIKRMDSKGSFRKFLDFSPLLPRALHITTSGHLLVGVREKGEAFLVKSKSCRQLIVMDLKGKTIHTYQFGKKKRKRLFSVFFPIATSSKDDIFLIDTETSEGHGLIAALSYPKHKMEVQWKQ